MKKYPNFVFRTINKKGFIKFDKKLWKPEGDISHIKGKRLVFGVYKPHESEKSCELMCLWGTIELYKHNNPDDKKELELWNEVCEMMGVKQRGDGINIPSGSYLMTQDKDNWIAYKDRNIYWWYINGHS